MLIDYKTGRIAFHFYRFNEDGSTTYVQKDFDGSILYEIHQPNSEEHLRVSNKKYI